MGFFTSYLISCNLDDSSPCQWSQNPGTESTPGKSYSLACPTFWQCFWPQIFKLKNEAEATAISWYQSYIWCYMWPINCSFWKQFRNTCYKAPSPLICGEGLCYQLSPSSMNLPILALVMAITVFWAWYLHKMGLRWLSKISKVGKVRRQIVHNFHLDLMWTSILHFY